MKAGKARLRGSCPNTDQAGTGRASVGRLAALFSKLDEYAQPFSMAELLEFVGAARIELRDVGRRAQFSDACYQRNVLHTGPAYQALALCWRSGQRSPIHDHTGSVCVVRVLSGTATETVFARSGCGLVYPTHSHELQTGAVIASQDSDIHQMGNLQPAGHDLVTLHVYSPPLLVMPTYVLGNSLVGEHGDALRAAIRARAAERSSQLGGDAASGAAGRKRASAGNRARRAARPLARR